MAAVVEAQTSLSGKVPTTTTAVFDLALDQSEQAPNRLTDSESEKNRVFDHVTELKSEQVKWDAEVLFLKAKLTDSRFIKSL